MSDRDFKTLYQHVEYVLHNVTNQLKLKDLFTLVQNCLKVEQKPRNSKCKQKLRKRKLNPKSIIIKKKKKKKLYDSQTCDCITFDSTITEIATPVNIEQAVSIPIEKQVIPCCSTQDTVEGETFTVYDLDKQKFISQPVNSNCLHCSESSDYFSREFNDETEADISPTILKRYVCRLGVKLISEDDISYEDGTDFASGTTGTCSYVYIYDESTRLVSKHFKKRVRLYEEIKYLSKLQHLNGIQRLVGVCPERSVMITEDAGLSLYDFVFKYEIPDTMYMQIMYDLISICQSVIETGYVHNDLKLANVCIEIIDEEPKVTLIDFNLACAVNQRYFYNSYFTDSEIQSCPWIKPSVMKGGKCNESTEAYSLAYMVHQYMKLQKKLSQKNKI